MIFIHQFFCAFDQLLNRTEQDLRKIELKENELKKLIRENEALKKQMQQQLDREQHQQQVELLKHQNKISEEKLVYLKDMERKLKQIVSDWRRAEDDTEKKAMMKHLQALLFQQKEKQVKEKVKGKLSAKYKEMQGEPSVGDLVLMRLNNKVGTLSEIRGKKAIVNFGNLPLQVNYSDLKRVALKEQAE